MFPKSDATICEGESAQLSVTVTGGSGVSTYTWQIEGPVNTWTTVGNQATYTSPALITGVYL